MEMEGPLQKFTGKKAGWQLRSFSISNGALYMSRMRGSPRVSSPGGNETLRVSSPGGGDALRGCIDLAHCTVTVGHGAEHADFDLQTGTGRLPLRAKSPEERSAWVAALRSASGGGSGIELSSPGPARKTVLLDADLSQRLSRAQDQRAALQRDIEEVLTQLPLQPEATPESGVPAENESHAAVTAAIAKATTMHFLQFVDICLSKLGTQ
jgi:hypothetical protein